MLVQLQSWTQRNTNDRHRSAGHLYFFVKGNVDLRVLYMRTFTIKHMQKISTYVVALLLPVMLVPQFAQAQAVDRAALIDLISLLQQQIVMLQAQLDARQANPLSDDGLLDDFPGTIMANYDVHSELQLPDNAPFKYQKYADQLRALFPTQYRNYIDRFVVFDNHPDDIAAFVAVTSNSRDTTWMYGVSVEEINITPTKGSSMELMVHEFAHVFSLDQLLTGVVPATDCHRFFDDTGCFVPGSYLDKFVDEFWDEELLDGLVAANQSRNSARALQRFYERYGSEFVSDYAAVDPSEDFAESFAWYVLDEPVQRGTIAADKVDFMNQFPAIRAYKKHIQAQI